MSTLEEFLTQTPDMVFVADVEGLVLRSSAALDRRLGSGADLSLIDLAHPDDRDAFKAKWSKLIGDPSGEAGSFRCRVRIADGSHANFLCNARRPPGGDEVCGSLVLEAIESVEVSRPPLLLQAIAQNLDIVVWEMDREGVFKYQRGKGLAAMGLKDDQLLGQSMFELYAQNPEGIKPLRAALKGEATHFIGQEYGIDMESWTIPLRNEEGGPVIGVAGITLNITPAKRTERELMARLDLIERQKQAIQALSIPIIQVWDHVLTVPLVGMVDSMRAGELMEKLLAEVVRTRAAFAILDLTGVDAMDTGTASHMLRLVSALRLLGAEGILTGIQPSIAHTMVGLGLEMGSVKTLANLREGLRFCMDRMDERLSMRDSRQRSATRRGA